MVEDGSSVVPGTCVMDVRAVVTKKKPSATLDVGIVGLLCLAE